MKFLTPSLEEVDHVQRKNLEEAREYVNAVILRLRRDMVERGIGIADLCRLNEDTGLQLLDGTIRGLDRIGHDGRPSPIKVPWPASRRRVGAGPVQEHFDVAAVVTIRDLAVEACYEYKNPTVFVSAKASGRMDVVRIDVTIGHPVGRDGVPVVKSFGAPQLGSLSIPRDSLGILDAQLIKEETEAIISSKIEDVFSNRVVPLLKNVLKTVPYPEFATDVQQ